MMRFDPSFLVRRFAVERDGLAVYDETFHQGVNILRGANGSGKSTILNFLFYALGGDVHEWSEHAQLCSNTWVELEASGKIVTLRRTVATSRGQSMDFFAGPLVSAVEAPISAWVRYPYSRSQQRDGFSQALFRIAEIPEAAGEQSGNVTMHQVLRALYADQLTPVDQLFRFERFDSASLRDAVGRLLCGAYDNERYNNQLRIRNLEREYEQVSGEQRSLFSVLGKTEKDSSSDLLASERSNVEAKLDKVRKQIDDLESQIYLGLEDEKISLSAQEEAYGRLRSTQIQLGEAREEADRLDFEVADAERFLADLTQKLSALNDAEAVSKQIQDIRFQFCPACYAVVEDENPHACHLCKTPYDSERAKLRIVALINDTALQLRQSKMIQTDRIKERETVRRKMDLLASSWRQLANQVDDLRRTPSSEARARISSLQREIGYSERLLEDITRREGIAELIAELGARRDKLSGEIAALQSSNENIEIEQLARLSRSYSLIADEIRYFLHNDLPRQDEFTHARDIQFSFEGNRISVDGHNYFAASSRVVLRNSFFSGFLYAACRDAKFRHPRFCMMDSIEDKGMEPARSHNYQKLLLQKSNESTVRHQLIFGTSMIAAELDVPELTIGRATTVEDKTLNFKDPKKIASMAEKIGDVSANERE